MSAAASMAGPMASRLPTSSGTTCARRPSALILRRKRNSVSRASSLAARATSAPASASARPMARPMPRLAPVTKARRPSRRNRSRTGIAAFGDRWLVQRSRDGRTVHARYASSVSASWRMSSVFGIEGCAPGVAAASAPAAWPQRSAISTGRPAASAAVNTPQKASPAPVVSTTFVRNAGLNVRVAVDAGDKARAAQGDDAASASALGKVQRQCRRFVASACAANQLGSFKSRSPRQYPRG